MEHAHSPSQGPLAGKHPAVTDTLPRPALLGQGIEPRPALVPTLPAAGPLSIPIDAAVESTLGPVCAAPRGENPGFWRRQGGRTHTAHMDPGGGPRRETREMRASRARMAGHGQHSAVAVQHARPGSLLAAS